MNQPQSHSESQAGTQPLDIAGLPFALFIHLLISNAQSPKGLAAQNSPYDIGRKRKTIKKK